MKFKEKAAGYMVKIKVAAEKFKAKIMQMPPQKRKKLFIGVGLGLLVFLLLIRGIISRIPAPIEKEVEKVVRVRAFKAMKADFMDELPAIGLVLAEREVELSFEINGVVEYIFHREGDVMQMGDVIASLRKEDAQLKFEYAQSKCNTATSDMLAGEKRLEVFEELFKAGTVTKTSYEKAILEHESEKSKAVSAEKELEFARLELEKTDLAAPIGGAIGTIEVEEGEWVTPSTKITTLYDINNVYVDAGIIEKDMTKVAPGQTVKVKVDTYPLKEYIGVVERIAPVIGERTRSATAKVKIVNDDTEHMLLPGMFARANILVFEKKEAIIVPTLCVQDSNNDGKPDSVYLIKEQKAQLVPVETGYASTDFAEIIEGISEGDLIVTEAEGSLEDQPKVEITETEEAFRG